MVPILDEQKLGLREVDDQELLDIPAEVSGRRRDPPRDRRADARGPCRRRSVSERLSPRASCAPARRSRSFRRPPCSAATCSRSSGPARRVEAAVRWLGVPDRATDVTDMVLVALGIVAGALIGIPAIRSAGDRDRSELERRRAARRSRLRLAAVHVAAFLRPHPFAYALGVRVARARRVRGGRRTECRTGFRDRPADERRQPVARRPGHRHSCRT